MAWLEQFWFGCGHCHRREGCAVARPGEPGPGGGHAEQLRGAHLVLPAVAVFLVPLMTAKELANGCNCDPKGVFDE